jgi:hypothetical protein
MLGVVLPVATATATATLGGAVTGILPIAVIYEIVTIIYIYIVIPSPSAVAAPSAAKGGTHGYAHSERKSHSGCVIPSWRIVDGWIGIGRGAVNHYGVIAGNVDNLRVGLFDHDHLLAFHHLRFNFHLLCGFQIPLLLGLRPHALHSIHDIGLLGQNNIAKVRRPLDVIREPFDDIRKGSHSLNGGIPVLFLHCVRESLVLQILVLRQPLLELHDFQWVCGGSQDLSKKWIWVEGDRRYKRVQLVIRNLRRYLRRWISLLLYEPRSCRCCAARDQQQRANHCS